MSEWKEYKLGDVVTFQRGFDITSRDFKLGHYPVISSSGITGYHSEFMVNGPGVIIGRKGTLGTVHFTKCDYWPHDTTLWVKDFHGNFPLFIFYFLKIMGFEQYDVGTSNPTLNRNHIHLLPVIVPNYDIQQSIAEVLSSLDDKIDLLHRQNKTLEQMAETLFRQWFVEEEKETDSLVKLGSFIQMISGYSYRSVDLNPSKIALVTLKSFERTGGFSVNGFKEYTGKFKEDQVVKSGDLVVAHTDITQNAEVLGNPAIVIDTGKYEKLVISTDLVKVEPISYLSKAFLYFLMKTDEFKHFCLGLSNGTTVLHLSKKALPEYEFCNPRIEYVNKFTSFAEPLLEKINTNNRQIQHLEVLRDTLLPKLMNGSVRVTEK